MVPEATRGLDDLRFVLPSLKVMPRGPQSDLRRVAAFGHSLGGSSSALLMRAEPAVLASVDLDGSIWGSAARHGAPRAFMVMAAGDHTGVLSFPETGRFLRRSQGPMLALEFKGYTHFSFSDVPILAPGFTPGDSATERAYLRAFLDRYVVGKRSPLLAGNSTPRIRVDYRHRCCR